VLNINRRLEQQQNSVDAIQGNISKLTEMVAQLGINLHRAPHENLLGSTVPDTSNNRFHTPPPPPPNLSPITENTTEQQSPIPQSRPQQQ
jgi:hypothetical protein